jgi:hypothetical protein
MDVALIESYSKTDYKIFDPVITIKVGQICFALEELLEEHNQQSWAFITSCNPYSKPLSEELNTDRLERLREKLAHYPLYLGAGIGKDPNWKPELSFLVLGISKEEACRLGMLFEQNAIVVGRKRQAAELAVLI